MHSKNFHQEYSLFFEWWASRIRSVPRNPFICLPYLLLIGFLYVTFTSIFCHLVQGLCKGWTLTTCRYSNTNLPVHKYLERKAFCKTFMASIKILTMGGRYHQLVCPVQNEWLTTSYFESRSPDHIGKKCYFLRSSLSFLVLHSRAGDSLKLQ